HFVSVYVPSTAVFASGRTTIGDLFHRRAPAHPARPAIVDGARAVTHAELDERTNRLARGLAGRGLGRGDRVAVLARNCLEYLEIELAAAKIGVIVACLNWRLGDRELTHSVRLVEPKLLIVQTELTANIDRLALPAIGRLVIGEDYERALDAASS